MAVFSGTYLYRAATDGQSQKAIRGFRDRISFYAIPFRIARIVGSSDRNTRTEEKKNFTYKNKKFVAHNDSVEKAMPYHNIKARIYMH